MADTLITLGKLRTFNMAGIDLTQGTYGYPDRMWLYDSTAVDGNTLVKDAEPICRFNKFDKVPFGIRKVVVNGIVTNDRIFSGTIETADFVELKPDMYCEDEWGNLFIITSIPSADDSNIQKELSARPTTIRTAILQGVKND